MLQNKNIELRAFAQLIDLCEKEGYILIGMTFRKAKDIGDEIEFDEGIRTVPSQTIAELITQNPEEDFFTDLMMIDQSCGKPKRHLQIIKTKPFGYSGN